MVQKVNRKVIDLLRFLSDDGQIKVIQNSHIKVSGIFQGKKRSITLSSSPVSYYYEKNIRSLIRRFIQPLNLDQKTLEIIGKKFIHL